jgi:DNA-binding response OmpR family regulator
MKTTASRIAVADTDRTVLELLQIRLELSGHRVYVSRDSAELMEAVKNARPNAMILDYNLQGAGAKGVMEELRRKSLLTFPVLLMGRNLTPENLQEIMQLGARSCIVKPFSGQDILERVSWLMRPAPAARPVHYLNV